MSKRILIADRHGESVRVLRLALKADGHSVMTVVDAAAALASVMRFLPHLALIDAGMPGMDMHELARRIRAQQMIFPVRLIAVYDADEFREDTHALASGFTGVLRKPVLATDVQALIEKVCGRSRRA